MCPHPPYPRAGCVCLRLNLSATLVFVLRVPLDPRLMADPGVGFVLLRYLVQIFRGCRGPGVCVCICVCAESALLSW